MEVARLIYKNDMRAALHAVPNPTGIPVDVGVKDGVIYLLVDNNKYQALEPAKRKDFRAYVRTLVRTVELAGGQVQVSRLQEPR